MKSKFILFVLFICSIFYIRPLQAQAAEQSDPSGYKYTVDDTTKEAVITGYTGSDTNLTIPESLGSYKVTSIGADAFLGKQNITTVEIPGSVKTIGSYAFKGCSGLKTVTIADGCETIKLGAFLNNYKLEHITIPKTVKTLEYHDEPNEIFYGISTDNIRFYVFPDSAAEIYLNMYKKTYTYYYLPASLPTSIRFKEASRTLNLFESIPVPELIIEPASVSAYWKDRIILTAEGGYLNDTKTTFTATQPGRGNISAHLAGTHFESGIIACDAPVSLTIKETRSPVEQVYFTKDGSRVEKELSIQEGEQLNLSLTVVPGQNTDYTLDVDLSYNTVQYDSAPASLSRNGTNLTITGNREGWVDISYYLTNNVGESRRFSEVLRIWVAKPESYINLNKHTINLYKGETTNELKVTGVQSASPVQFSSANEKVARIDQNGTITAVGKGSTTITAKTAEGAAAYCTVNVKTGKIKLNAARFNLQKGKTIKTLAIKSSALKNDRIVNVTSSNKHALKASLSGQTIVLKGRKAGSKYITVSVTTKSGAKASCKIKVTNTPVKTAKLSLNKKSLTLKKGKTTRLTVTRNPISSLEKLTWKSSNTKIVSVDKNGKLRARKKGKATITVTSTNGKKAVCKVTVK